LRKGAKVIPAVAATHPHPLAGGCGKGLHHGGRNRLVSHAGQHRPPVFRLGLGLIPDRFQADDALLQGRVVQICHTTFDRVVEAFEPQIRLRSTLVQLGDMFLAALCPLLAAVKDG
jgi:hypothetical protein